MRPKSQAKRPPAFEFLQELQALGYHRVVGVDEVGRGALAGPVVVVAVELNVAIEGIHDSKLLTAAARIKLNERIVAAAGQLSIGQASNREIDELGLAAALALAYRRALRGIKADLILTDAYTLKTATRQLKAVRGDSLFYPVAAASIVAKVYRDSLMQRLHPNFSAYGWLTNVGYGTKTHLDAINAIGSSIHHRQTFLA